MSHPIFLQGGFPMDTKAMEAKAKYKCHQFYRIGTREKPFERPELYAFTFDKKLAKLFKTYRDMDYFIYDTAEMTYQDHIAFKDHFKCKNITIGRFKTKNHNTLSTRPKEITLPCTWEEEENVFMKSEWIIYELGRHINFLPMIRMFNEEYDYLIENLKVPQIYQFYQGQYAIPNMNPTDVMFTGCGSSTQSIVTELDIRVDELALFIYCYSDTLRNRIDMPYDIGG